MHDAAVRSGTSYQLLLERDLKASRELVFEVWSEPKHLANWWGPNGFSMPSCEVDFRVGGKYRCDTLVEVNFEANGDTTHFRLHQSGFGSSTHRDEHRGGWSECLNRLSAYVTVPR